MSAAKVTVGIPTFNRAGSGWLRESIASVLAQTFTGFRLIVSDNASTDDTPDVVRSFDDERIDYVRSERNVGAIGNLNRLIALADTEFLVLLPDDDILYPEHLGTAVELLERFQSAGLSHSAFDMLDAGSRVIQHAASPLVSHSPVMVERRDLALERLMVSHGALAFPSVVYRTKAIRQAGGLREEEEPFCDRQMWMRMALDWDFAYIAKPLIGFRTHPESITTRLPAEHGAQPDGRGHLVVYSQINFRRRMDFLEQAPLEPRETKRLSAIAKLQRLDDCADLGLPWGEVAARLAGLVRMYPRLVLRQAFWRLVVAQLGGRRARSALRVAAARHHRLGQGVEGIRSVRRSLLSLRARLTLGPVPSRAGRGRACSVASTTAPTASGRRRSG